MIEIDISKCTGCRRCETACSFYHTGKTSNRVARIKVQNLYEIGIDGPIVCQQCKERYCNRCPNNALTIGRFGQVIISPTICKLCKVCEKACPIGAIEMFEDFVYVCDLCGGKPKCIEACTEGAIAFNESKTETISLKSIKADTKKMNSSEKRSFFIKKLGIKIRKQWRLKHV